MLRTVQSELDEIVLAREGIRRNEGGTDLSEGDNGDAENQQLPDAPSEDQMRLPFATVQEEFETSFRKKAAVLRD